MKAVLNLLFFLMISSCTLTSKQDTDFSKSKKEIFLVLKQLNASSQKEEASLLFTKLVQCTFCESENGYDNEYFMTRQEFIDNHLADVDELLNYNKINNLHYKLLREGDLLVLSYPSSQHDKTTYFEGSSVLISFKQENKMWKIYAIQTIP